MGDNSINIITNPHQNNTEDETVPISPKFLTQPYIVDFTDNHDIQSIGSSAGHEHYSHRSPWLRAALLGANDGLVSTGSLILGVVAANLTTIVDGYDQAVLAGLSGLVAGSLAMACGEYISVASQRDSELADIALEVQEHERGPRQRKKEFEELIQIYMDRGLDRTLAHQVALALTKKDVIGAHMREELGIDIENLTSPWKAALASCVSFAVGAIGPLIIVIASKNKTVRIILIVIITVLMLLVFGAIGAKLGGAPIWKGSLRVAIGGTIAMAGTYGAGALFGATVG